MVSDSPGTHCSKDSLSHEEIDWKALQESSLVPGGFGSQRVTIWPQILRVNTSQKDIEDNHGALAPSIPSPITEPSVHQDEHQILLDTQRSFLLYPIDDRTLPEREVLQKHLHSLLVSVFRRHPKLSYFQGYHDIITVLFLTLPPELQFPCAEKLSLQRLRDSMGSSLEPVLGLLRLMRAILRLADPDYASLLEKSSPLPYFALSNLLTLCSHDMPTLPLVQHVFDYLFCRSPILSVYLATVIVLSRKDEVHRLAEEEEEGMIHSLLSGLPDIFDDDDLPTPIKGESTVEDAFPELNYLASEASTTVDIKVEPTENSELDRDEDTAKTLVDSATASGSSDTLPSIARPEESENGDQRAAYPDAENITAPSLDSSIKDEIVANTINFNEKSIGGTPVTVDQPARVRVSLSSLLTQADELYATYPPTHPGIAVSSIMGPRSVIFTWTEDASALPTDEEAEAIVEHLNLIVHPHVEPEPDDTYKAKAGRRKEHRRSQLRRAGRAFGSVLVQRRTALAGLVAVLGIVMAVYGIRARTQGGLVGDGRSMLKSWLGGVLVGLSDRIMEGVMFW